MSASSPHLRARVLEAARATPARTRRTGRWVGAALLLASVLLAIGLFEYVGGLGHAAGRPFRLTLIISVGWSLACVALTWASLVRGRSSLSRRRAVLLFAAIAAPVATFFWLHAFSGLFAEPFERFGWRCLGYTLAMSALPLASFISLRRGSEPRTPASLGGAVGATVAAWAGLLVDLWCPLNNTPHVLVGHVVPIVIVSLLGALTGSRWLAPRFER